MTKRGNLMVDFERKIIGTEKNHVPLTSVSYDMDTSCININLNNGCIIVAKFIPIQFNRGYYEFHYDTVYGPIIKKDSQVYIWNSNVVNRSGRIKREFSISYDDLFQCCQRAIDDLFEDD